MNFEHIDRLKLVLDSLRPLTPAAVRNLSETERVEWTYHSNAIEGNTLTLQETRLVLEDRLTVGGKKLREHFEVINHAEAIHYVNEIVDRKLELTEHVIKSVHQLVLKNIDDENAGRYRTINVRISGSRHLPPDYATVPEEMERLMDWFNRIGKNLHPIELAATFHFQFVHIHPFTDGNGRTARLLMNLLLMGAGYPPAIVKADSALRLRYYETLELASMEGRIEPFVELIAGYVEESLRKYIHAVK